MSRHTVRHFHMFSGLGAGARGFNMGEARVGQAFAEFVCIGGVDVDAAACRDFEHLAGVPATCLDLFNLEQYRAWHRRDPPEGWREATPDDLRRAAHGQRPNIVFGSAPCKGFSGLLSQERSSSAPYQALNDLALRGLWLALEAWGDDPPELFLWENVPRIATRGRALLDTMTRMLEAYGYAVAETTHDCGELGGLAQTRKRFLLVARHREKVPPFLHQPPKRRLRAVGDVLGAFPLPGDPAAGPMHALRPLQFRTWVRLAFVRAGGDWRSLNDLRVLDGNLADFGLLPCHGWRGYLGVVHWGAPAGTIAGQSLPSNGAFSVADQRAVTAWAGRGKYGVTPWDEASGTVIAASSTGNGAAAVADPRPAWSPKAYRNKLRVTPWDTHGGAVIGARGPDGGALSVADPRPQGWAEYGQLGVNPWDKPASTITSQRSPGQGRFAIADPRMGERGRFANVYRVVRFDQPSVAVTAGGGPSSGGLAVADPRVVRAGDFKGAGLYGVVEWDATAGAVTAAASHDNGRNSVADPRAPAALEGEAAEVLPAADARVVVVIVSTDGTWHRPFSTLELAALQGLVEPGEALELCGTSDTAHRERIGNAVPSPAAAAIASAMGRVLLLAWTGNTFALDSEPVWVRPALLALSVDQGPALEGTP